MKFTTKILISALAASLLAPIGAMAQRGGGVISSGGKPSYGTQGYRDLQNNNNEPSITAGTITSGNAQGLSLSIKSDYSGATRTILTKSSTPIVREEPILAGDIKLNDVVHVHMGPTGIAESIVVGMIPPALLQGSGGSGARANSRGRQTGSNTSGQSANGQSTTGSGGPIAAQVKSISPLVISYAGRGGMNVKLSTSTRISRVVPIAFASLKIGDHIFATGDVQNNGTFTALAVGVSAAWGSGTSNSATTGTSTSGATGKTATTRTSH